MPNHSIHLSLPAWINEKVDFSLIYSSDEARMRLAILLSHYNVEQRTGGPFGAAIFTDVGQLISVGVNQVVTNNYSIAHAEILAFTYAQAQLQRFRLNQNGGRFILATSAQPCCMCYGASFWAGIDEILIGARAEDVTRLTTFDEGPLPALWSNELEQRNIQVKKDLLREDACDVLRRYHNSAGMHY